MRLSTALIIAILSVSAGASAEDRLVGPGQPYGSIEAALADAVTGDAVIVSAGTYAEELVTRAAGVTLRAAAGEEVIVQTAGRVLDVQHDDTTVEGLILDGDYGDRSPVRVQADGFTLRDAEVRRSTRDCVALGGVADVRIEGSLIHRCLRSGAANCSAASCRDDAHGIGGGAVRGLVVSDTEIHTFSGDAIQLDSGRSDAGWSDLQVSGCRFWLAPLSSAEGGYAAGVVPGENAIDTKTNGGVVEPAVVSVTNTVAHGFRDGLIGNMAAYNIKDNVVATFDGVHVYDSEIAFRLSGPTSSQPRGARVSIANAVFYGLERAIRFEDDVTAVRVLSSTFGVDVAEAFDQDSSAPGDVIDPENLLFLSGAVPDLAAGGASMAVDASVFVDAAGHDYHLVMGASPIDMGADLPDVARDRDGNARPMGGGHDVGAYEWCMPGACAPAPDAGRPMRDAGPTPDGGRRDAGGGDGGRADAAGDSGGGPGGGDDGGCCSTTGHRRGAPPVALWIGFALVVAARGARRRP